MARWEHWKRNLVILCFAQLLTMTGFSSYLPFIPYYLQEISGLDYNGALAYLAIFEGGGALAMAVSAPVWGALADRYGRKMMLVRATAAGSILAFTLGLVVTPEQLIAVRILQGILCGTVAAAMTLVATETPDAHLGLAMGVMQTVQFAAHSIGPVVGGYAADTLGYRAVFPISAAMIGTSLLLIVLFVRERARKAQPARRAARPRSLRAALAGISRNQVALLATLASTSFAIAVVSPVLSLYIKSLNPDSDHIATIAGSILSVAALTSSGAALLTGRLGDRFGQKRVLMICMAGAALMHFPQSFVANSMQLAVLRAIQGAFMGGVMPTANALLARSTDPSRRGGLIGLASGMQAGGRALGPGVGAAAAGTWGMASVFSVTGVLMTLIAGLVGLFVHQVAVAPAESKGVAGGKPSSVAPVK